MIHLNEIQNNVFTNLEAKSFTYFGHEIAFITRELIDVMCQEWNYSHIHMHTFVGVGQMRTENLCNLIDCNDHVLTKC